KKSSSRSTPPLMLKVDEKPSGLGRFVLLGIVSASSSESTDSAPPSTQPTSASMGTHDKYFIFSSCLYEVLFSKQFVSSNCRDDVCIAARPAHGSARAARGARRAPAGIC